MRVRWPFVLLLVSVMVALAPLAYIELPDQIWLGGLFDDGDEDDAIVQIQTQLNAVESPALPLAPGSVPCIHAPPQRLDHQPMEHLACHLRWLDASAKAENL